MKGHQCGPVATVRWTFGLVALALAGSAGLALVASEPAGSTAPTDRMTTGAAYDGDFADPSVLVAHGRYYAYSTQAAGSNIPVISSLDLIHWSTPTDALPNLPSWAQSGFTWAPAVADDPAGGYQMFFAARDPELDGQCIGRATSSSPTGPFVDHSDQPFLCQTSLGGSIDPYVFTTAGTSYLIWKSDGANGSPQQIWSQQLDERDTALVGRPALLLSATSSWEDGVVEGPAMLATPSGLFLYFSGNRWSSSDYSIGVVGCDTPLGPCVNAPTGQEVSVRSHRSGPGGPTFFVAEDGRTLMAYAAWSGTPGTPNSRRELYIDQVDTTGTSPTLTEMLVPEKDR
jgi:beta-xylosidase